MNTTMRVLVLALAVAGLSACKTRGGEEGPGAGPGPSTPPNTTTETKGVDPDLGFKVGLNSPDSAPCLRQRVVNFDFDQAVIRPEFQEVITCHAKYLSFHANARLTLEGHADERGTREYNLGLGERRGNATSDLLKASGGQDSQLSVTSYGEERPTCNDSSEDCWSRNRRVELVYSAEG